MAKRNQFDEGFFAGLTAALIVLLHSHGEESYARHIIEASVNPAEFAAYADREGDEDIAALCRTITPPAPAACAKCGIGGEDVCTYQPPAPAGEGGE